MRESTIYQEIIQQGIKEGVQQGLQQGRQAEVTLILRQLNRQLGEINSELLAKIQFLSFAKLEELGEALLDFSTEADLVNWLNEQGS